MTRLSSVPIRRRLLGARLVHCALVLVACGEAEANPVARPVVVPHRPLRVRVSPPPPPLSQTAAAVVAAAHPPLTRPTELAVTSSVDTALPPRTEAAMAIGASDSTPIPTPPESAAAPPENVPPAPEDTPLAPENTAPAPENTPAHQLLARWLVTQNEGRFDDYAALYAVGFQGIKRSGARVRRFDRSGWLIDRRAMFGVAMHVHTRDVVVTPRARGAVVRFTQVFRAGRYHDEGVKELHLVEEGGRLLITREEMLQSRLGTTARPASELAPGAFMLAVHHGGATWVVLPGRVDPSWSEGDPTLVERADIVVTRRAAVPAALPPELAALLNADVRLFGPRSEVCSARVAELAVMRRVDPSAATEQRWDREGADAAAGQARLVASAWEAGAAGEMLVGRLDAEATACAGASWGRLSALPYPTSFVPIPPPPQAAEHALASFRLLPSWRTLQRGFETATGTTGRPWDEHGSSRPTATLWSDGTTQWVSMSQSIALGGCGQWRGELWALLEVEDDGLALRTDVTNPGYHVPVAATDADGDGTPDFVTSEGLIRRRGATHQLVDSLPLARQDQNCRPAPARPRAASAAAQSRPSPAPAQSPAAPAQSPAAPAQSPAVIAQPQ